MDFPKLASPSAKLSVGTGFRRSAISFRDAGMDPVQKGYCVLRLVGQKQRVERRD